MRWAELLSAFPLKTQKGLCKQRQVLAGEVRRVLTALVAGRERPLFSTAI